VKITIFFILALSIGLILNACTRSANENPITGNVSVNVEVYNDSPSNDPNSLDQRNAENILPSDKLNTIYKYKITKIGSFSAYKYLLKHKGLDNDAVLSLPGPEGKRYVRIYTNNPIPDSELL